MVTRLTQRFRPVLDLAGYVLLAGRYAAILAVLLRLRKRLIGILVFGETLSERGYYLVFSLELFFKLMQGTFHPPFERIMRLTEFLKFGR